MFRRLARHIGEHNWFAVIIEFVLIVVGVLMGVLLAGAIDRERLRNTGETYLAGLGTDYRVYQSLLVCRIEGSASVAGGLDRLVAVLDGDELRDEDRDAILLGLTYSHFAQTGLPIEGNTSALVSGALVETIRDTELRGLILAAQSTSTSSTEQMRFVQSAVVALPRLDAYTRRTRVEADDGPTALRYAVSEFDLAGLQADSEARATLTALINLHGTAEFSDRVLLDWVERVLERLQALGHVEDITRPERCEFGSIGG